MLLLTSCSNSENLTERKVIGHYMTNNIVSYKLNGHEYIIFNNEFTHSGECVKCKHELDSIVKNAVNEALEASLPETWNE